MQVHPLKPALLEARLMSGLESWNESKCLVHVM